MDTMECPTLVFATMKFDPLELEIPRTEKGDVLQNAQFTWSEIQLIDFYLPTPKQPWIKRIWGRWFRRNR